MLLSIIAPFLLFSANGFAAQELRFDFSYNRSIYGIERQNKLVRRTYSGSWNFFLTQLTAFELNYSYGDDITTENNTIQINPQFSVVSSQQKVNRQVYGVGLRQFFAHRRARLRPSISLGYAKQFVEDRTDLTIYDDNDDSTFVLEGQTSNRRDDSLFGSFSLDLRLSQTMALTASVNTVFKAFEFNRAGDNLRYLVGIRWLLL